MSREPKRERQRESIGSHVSTVSAVGLVHRAQDRNLSASVSFHTGWNSSQQYPRLQIIDRLLRVDMEAHCVQHDASLIQCTECNTIRSEEAVRQSGQLAHAGSLDGLAPSIGTLDAVC